VEQSTLSKNNSTPGGDHPLNQNEFLAKSLIESTTSSLLGYPLHKSAPKHANTVTWTTAISDGYIGYELKYDLNLKQWNEVVSPVT